MSNSSFFRFIVCLFLLHFYMGAYAQATAPKVSLHVQNATLNEIFNQLRKQTGLWFMYSNEELNQNERVSASFDDALLDEVLTFLVGKKGYTWVYKEKTVIIKREFVTPVVRDTMLTVTGKIINEKGEPVPGATVMLNGSKKGALSNAEGIFTIVDVPENAYLTITNISFLKQEIGVKGRTMLGNIVLQERVDELDVTVVKGYYKTTKRLNTGSVVTIKGEDIARQPVTNPLIALQGRAPNLVITPTSGLPNGAVNVQLRGQNSLSRASLRSEPLIIVDGVPYQNNLSAGNLGSFGTIGDRLSALSFINVNDIEQIDVLSDADATSIYGSRGGNGVILITTKRGKEGATRINMAVSTGVSQVVKKIDLLDTRQYLQMRREAYTNDGLAIPDRSAAIKNFSNFDLTVWDTARYTDWQEKFLGRSAPSYNANISVTGGTPGIQYLISGNYSTQKYVYPGKNKYESGGATMSINTSSADNKFKTFIGGTFIFNNALAPVTDFTRLAVRLAPNAPTLYTEEGALNWEPNPSASNRAATWNNPYSQLLRTSRSDNNSVRGSADIGYEVIKGLIIKAAIGYSEIRTRNQNLFPIVSYDPANSSATGSALQTNLLVRSLTFDPQLSYDKKISKGRLNVITGFSLQRQSSFSETIAGYGYTSDALLKSMGDAATRNSVNGSSQYKYAAVFGRISYNWEGKYLLNLTGRRDGSSRFGPGHTFGNFWSTGGAWIFTEEDNIKRVLPVMSFGKLRFSYGTSGNDGIGDYQYLELYEGINNITYQNLSLIKSGGAVNPDYHWEELRKLELALETGFFKDRLLISAAYWRTRADDQLGTYRLPATAGTTEIIMNQDARIQNMGWDFILTSRNINSEDLSWSTSANLGLQANKLLSMPAGGYNGYFANPFIRVGQPFTGFATVYESKGVNVANGLYQFSDLVGNVSTSSNNSYIFAKKIDTRPLTLGLSNNISWKRFSLSFFIQFTRQMGRNYLYDPAFSGFNVGSFNSTAGVEFGNLPVELLNHWRKPGDVSTIQRLTSGLTTETLRSMLNKARESDLAWVDASFIRLRNLSVSYDIPFSRKRNGQLQNIRVYMIGQNLLTITKYKGLDPEVQNGSVLPMLRSITGGIQLEL
ncbi:SusC/RagA family TonB-linked outer membrane protein [Chitinophaga tropicalis]|uniref:SusC/RagA family TonB-linked outer membrane protein n=1 Tax=Chitinophaga tropicalis TaxID=2683588 RepID=A0A7K1U7Q9_9BACT|nr:SusC/RagA family TonB-linked outer membrane protein [Chitinophaga tropicalis]MVT10381.1 SusC/RagA family TonB-linked outer membrane protein [Chitinophaga tropicalis]